MDHDALAQEVAAIAAQAERLETPGPNGPCIWHRWGQGPALVLLQTVCGACTSLTWLGSQALIAHIGHGEAVYIGRFSFAALIRSPLRVCAGIFSGGLDLSFWLTGYRYRLGRWLTLRNLMITMLLGGLWHGASWNFVRRPKR